jgi:hypothetical protein
MQRRHARNRKKLEFYISFNISKTEDAYDIHIIFKIKKEKKYEKLKKIFILMAAACKINFIFLRFKFI